MTTSLPRVSSFDEAAALYDREPNPMLVLEERMLPGLLPDLRGIDVADIGCGTGRWLAKLHRMGARNLIGVDPSREMLERAREKSPSEVVLREGTADSLPLATNSADLILMSFALSYCDPLDRVAAEIARVIRPGGCIFISDLHPVTEAQLNWRRTFASESGSIRVSSRRHDLSGMRRSFERIGLAVSAFLELPFTEDDWPMFAAAGKLATLATLQNVPAIYIAQFTTTTVAPKSELILRNARFACGPSSAALATISVSEGQVASVLSSTANSATARETEHEIDLSGCLLLPGLINAHDHLEFGLFPRLGRGPYQNSQAWATDIHAHCPEAIALHSRVPKDVRLYWGALQNLLAGVTTVCHHNPASPLFNLSEFPVHVIEDVGWAHSIAFDPECAQKFARSPSFAPFVIHAAEGTDDDARSELNELARLGILSDRTVIVHGLGCSSADIGLINDRGASLVVCPTSNYFLFGQTWEGFRLRNVRRSALGTDSSITARGNLLDELQFAREAFQFSPVELYEMCTSRSSSIFRLKRGEGTIRVGGVADFLVVRDTGVAPCERLLELASEDIELVFVSGRVHFASDSGLQRLPEPLSRELLPLRIARNRGWVRAPLPYLFREAHAVLGDDLFFGDKRVTYAD